MGEHVGTPTVSGLKTGAIDFALGAGGGLLVKVSQAVFGNGFLGALAGAGLAAGVIKGVKGEILAVVLGFESVMGGRGGSSSAQAPAAQQTSVI